MTFSECEEQLGLDWHEVTITRRVFREGGSEYFLNKTPCRLRDIHQLFMDTGIGRSAYSVMQQGKIDAILSSKAEDRRAIFEEAAGITKYKAQKKEAVRKLEATESNLVRLADIIKEVKRQIGSLQRQAGKARRYQSLIGDLKMLELHHSKQQWESIEAQRSETAAQLDAMSVRQGEHEVTIEQQEAEASALRAALEEMESKLNGARQTVNDFRNRISNHENRIVFNEERTREFEGLIERYRGDVAASEERFRMQEEQLHSTDAELQQITEMLAGELRHMEEKQAATAALTNQRAEIETALFGFTQDALRIENRISQLRGHISGVVQMREGAEARLALLADETRQLEFAFAQLTEERGHADTELARASAELEAQTAEVGSSEQALRAAQSSLAEIERELRDAQRVFAEKESRAEALRQLVESGEGFGEGTQAVLRGLDNPVFFKPAIAGALAQLIEVAPEYVRAVEAALNGHLQAVVMKDTMVAESVIKTLSSQKLGRAALALRELIPASPAPTVTSETISSEQLTPLRSLIRSGEDLAPLLDALLFDTYLTNSLAEAIEIRRTQRGTFVTREGEVITRDGLLIGGDAKEAVKSMLERKNQLHELEEEVAAARSKSWEISSRRETLLSEIDGAQTRLEEARVGKAGAAEQVSALRGQLSMLDRQAKDAERKQQTLEGEQASIEARHAEAATRLAQLEGDISAATASLETLQIKRTENQSELETLRAQEGELASELNELKIRVATERQRHSSLHHQRAPMEERLAELQELIAQRRNDIGSYEQRLAATETENAELSENLETLRARSGEAGTRGRAAPG
jgi:chromosome segregation protein